MRRPRLKVNLDPRTESRLRAESARLNVSIAELLRRTIVARFPEPRTGAELAKAVDREGLLKVLVLDTRDDQLLVEPLSPDVLFKNIVQLWVDGNLVLFPDPEVKS